MSQYTSFPQCSSLPLPSPESVQKLEHMFIRRRRILWAIISIVFISIELLFWIEGKHYGWGILARLGGGTFFSFFSGVITWFMLTKLLRLGYICPLCKSIQTYTEIVHSERAITGGAGNNLLLHRCLQNLYCYSCKRVCNHELK